MAEKILPPTSEDVKFYAVTLRLSPSANARMKDAKEASGLTKEELFSAYLQAGHAALTGNAGAVSQWHEYWNKVVAANKKST